MEPIGPPHFRGGNVRGELIALTGRQKGLRRLLSVPLTFIGRAAVCDVRLNMPGIDPFHCLFVFVPMGLMIRDLNSSTGTFINGERVSQVTVHDGDTLTVGTFQFLIRLLPEESDPRPPQENRLALAAKPLNAPSPHGTPGGEGWGEGGTTSHAEPPHPNPLPLSTGGEGTEASPTNEALRIQAAAIAAQHAAVTEEEIRLLQRQGALHEQEHQLSARFERERLQLEALHAQTQAERDALHQERSEYEDFVGLVSTCLGDAQKKLVESHQKIQAERRRLVQTHHRIKKHNQALLAAKQVELNWREEQLANDACNLQAQADDLAKQTQALEQERILLVTEHELDRRQLAESWHSLRREQASWKKRRRLERTALTVRDRDLQAAVAHLSTEARDMFSDKKAWRQEKQLLESELTCLDNRIRVQRTNLVLSRNMATDGTRIEHGQHNLPLPLYSGGEGRGEGVISPSRLLAWLADQRAELIEHWQILALTDEAWQTQRRQVVAALESLAIQLQEQERTHRQEEASLARRRDELILAEEQTAAWRSRLRVQEITWQADRARVLAEVQHREELARQHSATAMQALEGWNRRRLEELDQLRSERRQCSRLHEELAALRTEWLERNLEPAELHEVLKSQLAAIDARFNAVEQRLHTLLTQRAEFSEHKTNWERTRLEAAQSAPHFQKELRISEARRLQMQKELGETREELERLATVLLDKPTFPAVASDKAA